MGRSGAALRLALEGNIGTGPGGGRAGQGRGGAAGGGPAARVTAPLPPRSRGQVHVPAAAGPGVPRVAPGGRAGGAVAEGGGGRRGGEEPPTPPPPAARRKAGGCGRRPRPAAEGPRHRLLPPSPGSRLRQPPAAAVPGAVPLVLHLPDLLLPGPAEGAAGEAGRARGTRAGVREVRVQRQVRHPAATPRVPCGRSSPTAASTRWPSQPGRCQAIALLRLCMMPRAHGCFGQ